MSLDINDKNYSIKMEKSIQENLRMEVVQDMEYLIFKMVTNI